MTSLLTAAQAAAVEHFQGPLLVLAGPGSGKTRVITFRIARLLERGVRPDQILALTFTNKAAREMADRVQHLLGGARVQVSTFHRFCARLLRRWPESAGLRQNFTILDQSDQVRLVRDIMKDEGLDTVFHEPGRILGRISRARNDLISAEEFRRRFEERIGDPLDAVVYQVFPRYEKQVLQQNAVDFDDLLLHVVRMLDEDESLRSRIDSQFPFILVDEYQDTNLAQYRIVHAISQECPNLCATGDPDQSIYGWRGARPDNIRRFEQDFPDVQVISLDENFRSTQSIVRCAEQLISCNHRPHRGVLTTANAEGTRVRLTVFDDGEHESSAVAQEIARRVAAGERSYSDFAVFYRVNALSRAFETAFSQQRIPYQVASGFSFYERPEIRDLIAWLRLIENPADNLALLRIINRPARGVGARTLQQLSTFAGRAGCSLFDAARRAPEVPGLSPRSRRPLTGFVDLVNRLAELAANGPAAPVLERLIADIDYLSLWTEDTDEVDVDRAANVHELISSARQYDASCEDEDAEPPSLQGFLERACLSSEVDNVQADQGRVTLMTVHAAKGLEFPVVYIAGVENGLMPHERAVRNGDPAGFEEERRLLFVGITRAMQELTLTQTRERTFRGARRTTISSPFIAELSGTLQREDSELAPVVPPITAAVLTERIQAARQRFEQAQSRKDQPKLITAAQLEAQRSIVGNEQTTEHRAFTPGMLVRHPRYGRGTVTAVSSISRLGTVTVLFENGERSETFVLGKCPLQPVGLPGI